MTDNNFNAYGIDHYYAVGCCDGFYSFDIAYTSDEMIAVALRDALENTWQKHPNKRYRVQGFNGNVTVLEPYGKPHERQYFWISVLSSINPMGLCEESLGYMVTSNRRFWSSTFAVCASMNFAKKLGLALMNSENEFRVMNGFSAVREELNDILCTVRNGERINTLFKEGRL